MRAGTSHITSIVVSKPAEAVHAYMADPHLMHRWSFGTWETEVADDGLVLGTSLFDGGKGYVHIDADKARLSVDYHIGATPQALVPRILVKVIPGASVGLDAGRCVLTFVAWRTESMDDDRWRRLTAAHELEVVLIKAQLER